MLRRRLCLLAKGTVVEAESGIRFVNRIEKLILVATLGKPRFKQTAISKPSRGKYESMR